MGWESCFFPKKVWEKVWDAPETESIPPKRRSSMKKLFRLLPLCVLILLSLTGCSAIGDKAASMAILYDITAAVSLLLLVSCCFLIRRKNVWYLLLFTSVFIVNIGYMVLAHSRTLEEALLANRISYLGSVCLPMSMLMIIVNACRLNYRKWFPWLLLGVAALVFLIAASPGYSDIYYREVSLSSINGVTVLEKVYGPWHCLYLVYLLAYFAVMTAAVIHAALRRKISSPTHIFILAAAVFVNMGVWLLEQIVRIDLELLSVSYIISELFLLCLYLLLQEKHASNVWDEGCPTGAAGSSAGEAAADAPATSDASDKENASEEAEKKYAFFSSQLPFLTPTERIIYERYLSGISTKEIMSELNIKENTLKYHNKNIYGKLGVSSRKQLMEIAAELRRRNKPG